MRDETRNEKGTETMGTQRITQRLDACNCGCKGSDSWHAKTLNRTIKQIVEFAEPQTVKIHLNMSGTRTMEVNASAIGVYQHPSGKRRACARWEKEHDGKWFSLGWHACEEPLENDLIKTEVRLQLKEARSI